MTELLQRIRAVGVSVLVLAALAVSQAVQAGSHSELKRYVIHFSSPDVFENVKIEQERAEQFGTVMRDVQLFNSSARVAKTLNALELVVVETDQSVDLEMLAEHPAVAFIEEEIFYPAPEPMLARGQSTTSYVLSGSIERPWGIDAVKAPEAWETTKGEGVRVLVLDTGLDKSHEDLAGRFEAGRNFAREVKPGAPYPYFDENGHGTHVAGTVLADGQNSGLVGVAPEARLLAGRVCDRGCSSIAIVEGVNWGVEQKVDVINMSLGGLFSSAQERVAYERAEQAGVVIVAASGNSGFGRVSYPAAIASIVAVGAINSDLEKADFSQWGPQLDIMAPGVDVNSSVPEGMGRDAEVLLDRGEGFDPIVSRPFMGSPVQEDPVQGKLVYTGLGKPDDFRNVDLRGHIALIKRGEITFRDKTLNAIRAGAKAVVIFNNEPGPLNGSLSEDGSEVAVPVIGVEQELGEEIVELLQARSVISVSVATVRTNHSELSGTSMASPHVAGVAALILGANPFLTPAQVREILRNTATPVENNEDNRYGRGIVNAEKAVAEATQILVAPWRGVVGF